MDNSTWTTPERPRVELFGSLAGKIELADDWDSPETNKEIADPDANLADACPHAVHRLPVVRLDAVLHHVELVTRLAACGLRKLPESVERIAEQLQTRA